MWNAQVRGKEDNQSLYNHKSDPMRIKLKYF